MKKIFIYLKDGKSFDVTMSVDDFINTLKSNEAFHGKDFSLWINPSEISHILFYPIPEAEAAPAEAAAPEPAQSMAPCNDC